MFIVADGHISELYNVDYFTLHRRSTFFLILSQFCLSYPKYVCHEINSV